MLTIEKWIKRDSYGRCRECGGRLACRLLGEVEERVEEPFCYVIDTVPCGEIYVGFWIVGLGLGLMPVTYSQFLTLIATALRDENGLDLAYLIRPVSSHSKDLIKEFRNPTVRRFSPTIYP